ncbi:hypothetical protein CASFOL_009653 [Castilleja foliolosa]|uniref:Uncharacterized protein n=1 Tax=Castilleja foliolosa TaxID=1961234 RepID=A0ABD3DQ95_9LAMI
MGLQSWLPTRSSAAPSPTGAHSDSTSSFSSEHSHPNSSTSILTNFSLLTLPSVPSLQTHTPCSQNDAVQPPATAVFLNCLNPHNSANINFIAVHNNLLYAASDNIVNVYLIKNNSKFAVDNTTSGAVKSISFCNGKIFTGHQDCKIRVWELNNKNNNNHKLISVLPTLKDRARRFILPQNYVKIRRHEKKLWIQHYDVVSGLVPFQNDENNLVISTSWDKSIKIWRARDNNLRCLESINKAHDDAINCVVISNDGLVYTGSADNRIKAWKSEGGKYGLLATLEKHKSAVNALALSVDGSVLFSGSCDRSILVWEKEDSANHMAVTGALRGHAKAILCLINVRDLLMSGSGDRTVRIWRRGFDGKYCCLAVLDGHLTPVRSLAAAEDDCGGGVKVFSGSFDGEIRVWQVEVGSVKDYD